MKTFGFYLGCCFVGVFICFSFGFFFGLDVASRDKGGDPIGQHELDQENRLAVEAVEKKRVLNELYGKLEAAATSVEYLSDHNGSQESIRFWIEFYAEAFEQILKLENKDFVLVGPYRLLPEKFLDRWIVLYDVHGKKKGEIYFVGDGTTDIRLSDPEDITYMILLRRR